MGGKLFLGRDPTQFNLDHILKKLKVDKEELEQAIEKNRDNLPIHSRGISYQMFKNYLTRASNCMDKHPTKFDYNMTSYTMLDMVKQDTQKWNCSLSELVKAVTDVAKTKKLKLYPPMFHKPTHFLSYCWAFPLNDIYGETMNITKTNGDNWGLWIDILTINQHQGEKTKEDLNALDRCIQDIGNVIFVIDAKGTAMTRVWCLFEIMTAVRTNANITAVFMGHKRSAYEAAMIGLSVLSGRFDAVDVRNSEATVASDKNMILNKVKSDPGIDEMNQLLRTTLRKCAMNEFQKNGHNFGSSWWSAETTFMPFIMEGLLKLIKDNGGWEGMMVTEAEEERALKVAIDNGTADGKNLNFWKPKFKGDLDPDTTLYNKLEICLNLLTWGQRKKAFEDWDEVLDKIAKAEAWQIENKDKKKDEDEEEDDNDVMNNSDDENKKVSGKNDGNISSDSPSPVTSDGDYETVDEEDDDNEEDENPRGLAPRTTTKRVLST